MKYTYKKQDFQEAFEFGIQYFLNPAKLASGRTSAEPRGLGGVLNDFTRGKLTEIGAKKLIESLCKKEVVLDFEIKPTSSARNDPDIIAIKESSKTREPKLFIEIKTTAKNDRWIGLTKQQLATIKLNSRERPIYNIYLSLNSQPNTISTRSTDLVGMFLKSISKPPIFANFADLNASGQIEFILSSDDLEKYGTDFPKGNLFYETELFYETASVRYKNEKGLKKNTKQLRYTKNPTNKINIPRRDGVIDSPYCEFTIKGIFNLFVKKNKKTKTNYIECISDVCLNSDIFGAFTLQKDKTYNFNLETVGQDPTLKRDNIFLSKRRIEQLIRTNTLKNPATTLREIANKI